MSDQEKIEQLQSSLASLLWINNVSNLDRMAKEIMEVHSYAPQEEMVVKIINALHALKDTGWTGEDEIRD